MNAKIKKGHGDFYFTVRSHTKGARKYKLHGDYRTKAAALKAMAAVFATGLYNRCDVLRCANFMSYYGPIAICELREAHWSLG